VTGTEPSSVPSSMGDKKTTFEGMSMSIAASRSYMKTFRTLKFETNSITVGGEVNVGRTCVEGGSCAPKHSANLFINMHVEKGVCVTLGVLMGKISAGFKIGASAIWNSNGKFTLSTYGNLLGYAKGYAGLSCRCKPKKLKKDGTKKKNPNGICKELIKAVLEGRVQVILDNMGCNRTPTLTITMNAAISLYVLGSKVFTLQTPTFKALNQEKIGGKWKC